jgi:hypothetical protein
MLQRNILSGSGGGYSTHKEVYNFKPHPEGWSTRVPGSLTDLAFIRPTGLVNNIRTMGIGFQELVILAAVAGLIVLVVVAIVVWLALSRKGR